MKRLLIALVALMLVGCGGNNGVSNTPNTNVVPSEPQTNSTDSATVGNNSSSQNQQAGTNQVAQTNKENGNANSTLNQGNNKGNHTAGNNSVANQSAPSLEEPDTQVTPDVTQTVAEQTYEKITEGIALNDVTMGTELFRDTYGIDPAVLTSYVVCMPTDNAEPTEIAVFEINDETSSDTVKLSIENRIQALNEQFGEQNFQIAEKNNVIVFIMSPQAEQMIQNFAK